METAKLPPRVAIPGIMEVLRTRRDQLSMEHLKMSAREELEYYERHRSEFALWPQNTMFANGTHY
jgi:hypothetical protein